MAEVLICSKYK